MHLQGYWHTFMAEAGNEPGAQQGDVIVTLIHAVGGIDEIRVPSDLVTIAAEAGNLIGIQLVTADGRHLFVSSQNLAGIVDAPKAKAKAGDKDDDEKDEGPTRPHRAGARSPVVVSGT